MNNSGMGLHYSHPCIHSKDFGGRIVMCDNNRVGSAVHAFFAPKDPRIRPII
jgi:hypothetical protein